MRTSNKFVFAALLLLMGSLFIYDELLKAEYTSGNYKNPSLNFVSLNYKGFDTVDLPSSSWINVKFVQGPFSVKIDKDIQPLARITQKGQILTISAVVTGNSIYSPHPYLVLISCPKLLSLHAGATYRLNDQQMTDSTVWDWQLRSVLIRGFKEDSLSVSQDHGSTVVLDNNTVGLLRTVTGMAAGSGSILRILKNNRFAQTRLDIKNRSQLELNDTPITKLHYHLADSAKMILNAAAANSLKKP